jgi:FOG: PAS/PAC domain
MHSALTKGRGENERWHIRKDGSRFWGSGLVMPLRDAAGEVQGFLKIMQDKTERRQIEEALRQSENRYRTLADAVPQLMWINTADGNLEFANQHWQSYTGIIQQNFRWLRRCWNYVILSICQQLSPRAPRRFKQGNPTNSSAGCAGLTASTAGI